MPAVRWLLRPSDPEASRALAAALGIGPITAQVLLHRGYASADAARRYLDAALVDLSDPESIIDMPEAVERLHRATARGEPFTVFGDYDADGVTATSILVRGLSRLGARVGWYIPSRFTEGYGLNATALERLRLAGSRLVVAVDCGVTAVAEVASARKIGQEIVIVDHHEPGPQLPPAVAVIDPKRSTDAGRFREYSAAGLALQVVRAVRRRLGHDDLPEALLELAALGTIADVVPLRGDNRIIARAGLQQMLGRPSVGVGALIRASGITGEVTSRHVGFSLAPRLNAAGRLGDAGKAVRLLLTEDPGEADGIAAELDAANRARQQLCDHILAEAIERVDRERLHDGPAIVLAAEGWHAGVIGIVASQLVERYYRPVVLMAVEGGVGKGSARSIDALHMVEALSTCSDLLTRYGGHAMAAGLTIDSSRIGEFTRRFGEAAGARLRPEDLIPALPVDAEVPLGAVSDALARELRHLAPFGAGNPEPVLASRGLVAVSTRVMGDGLHLRLGVTDGQAYAEAVGFRLGDASELLAFTRARLDLAFTVAIDRWEDRERVQLMLRDLVTPGVDLDAVLTDSALLVDRLLARAADYLGDGALGLEEAGAFNTKVVGVTFEGRQEIVRTLIAGDLLHLAREPANPVDPYAVRVLTPAGRKVGYLSARVAARLAPSMDAGTRYTATVSQVTGGPTAEDAGRSYGVNIFVRREEMAGETTDPGRLLREAWSDLRMDELRDRLRIHLRRGRPLPAAQDEVIRAMEAGRPVCAVVGPGRGRTAVAAMAAAVEVIRRGGPVVIAVPLRGQVERWQARLTPLLARIGIRCVQAHGALLFRQRQRLLQMLAERSADVVIATVEYLRHAPQTLRPSLLLIEAESAVDAAASVGILEQFGRPRWAVLCASADAPGVAALREHAQVEMLGDSSPRTNLRLVDRRRATNRLEVLRDLCAGSDRALIRTGTRESAVEVASALRASGVRAAYYHGGIPLRVREVLEQAFADGRISVLAAADGFSEDALLGDVRQVAIAGLPADRAELAEWIGTAGQTGRQATITLLYGPDDLTAQERALAEIHPSRDVLAAVFRAVRGHGGAAWPDEDLAAALDGVVSSRRMIGIALDVLAEAGVVAREFDGERWRITLPEDGGRRDLTTSVRYTEGQREVAELGALGRFAFGPLVAILRAVAAGAPESNGGGPDVEHGPPTG